MKLTLIGAYDPNEDDEPTVHDELVFETEGYFRIRTKYYSNEIVIEEMGRGGEMKERYRCEEIEVSI